MEKANEIKISYKNNGSRNQLKINDSRDANKIIMDSWDRDSIELYESFKVVFLNNGNIVKGICTFSIGGLTGTMVDIRLIFATALKSLSTAIILTHNHPSGVIIPSKADIQLTKRIVKAGNLLDIRVLDHIIVTPHGSFYSFANEGRI
ncbi:JAB domain-containing protein [Maribacter halichondriae]|uniref:JAB domain-containing protein n=1 Tax=Maribacter halichondriae TaxID=2980554 RepID=UPI002358FAC5|nr:JAB domain-containing protein [Maribacter sp. Hal144]